MTLMPDSFYGEIDGMAKVSSRASLLNMLEEYASHEAMPIAAKSGLFGAGGGAIGGYMAGEDGDRAQSALLGALLGGSLGAGGGYMMGRQSAASNIAENFLPKFEHQGMPNMRQVKQYASRMKASDQKATSSLIKNRLQGSNMQERSFLPEMEDVFTLPFLASAGSGAVLGNIAGGANGKKNPQRRFNTY